MHARPLLPADCQGCLALAGRLTEGVAPWRDPDAVLRSVQGWVSASVAAAENPGRAVFVAEIDGLLVGMIALGERIHFTGQVDAYISELVVAKDAEGQGAGRALILAAERWASARGRSHITLETGAANDQARGFYRHLGYLEEDVRLTKLLR